MIGEMGSCSSYPLPSYNPDQVDFLEQFVDALHPTGSGGLNPNIRAMIYFYATGTYKLTSAAKNFTRSCHQLAWALRLLRSLDMLRRFGRTFEFSKRVQLTNETGSTSFAQLAGINGNTIVAPQWNLVQGTLLPDGSRINWSNGTFWNHCNAGGGATLSGTWFSGGDPSKVCSITQRLGALTFINESGVTASGNFDGPNHFSAVWQGQTIGGVVGPNGARIDWSNGTFWTR